MQGKLIFTGLNMTAGQVLKIDTEYKTATLNGVNVLSKLDANPGWFTLERGDNDIDITSDGADTVSIKVSWRDRWV